MDEPLTDAPKGHHAILLAAGAGRRFGGRKMLAPWRGEPLVLAAARAALAAPVEACVAVLGCDAAQVEAALAPLRSDRLRILVAEDWRLGLSASLRRGVLALPGRSRGAVVFLGDMPLVPLDAAARLLTLLEGGAEAAEVLCRGRPAHPVAFAACLYGQASSLEGDAGLRRVLRGRQAVLRIETEDEGSVHDVDEPHDLVAGLDLVTSRSPDRMGHDGDDLPGDADRPGRASGGLAAGVRDPGRSTAPGGAMTSDPPRMS